MGLEFSPLRPDERETAFRLRVRTFASPDEDVPWDPDAVYIPDDRRVVARRDGQLVGQLGVWPMHQVFGGREVPMGGVGGVAVAAHERGHGVGAGLLHAGLELMRERGDVVSSLYPATVAPYRAWGWALAGSHDLREVPTRALTTLVAPPDVTTRPGTGDDLAACTELARAVARTEPGGMVGPDAWYRRRFSVDEGDDGLEVAVRDGEVVGVACWDRRPGAMASWGMDVALLVGVDAAAERALWRQLGSWWSVAPTTRFVSWPTDPLLADLPELDTRVVEEHPWMTRLVDVTGAIAARGFPPGVAVTVPLRVHDDRVAANDGAFVLEVGDGRGALAPGGDGHVDVDVRDLAGLYAGFAPARVLARRGALSGARAADVDALAHAFDAPTPWMREYF